MDNSERRVQRNNRYYYYHNCIDCGAERLIEFTHGLPRNIRCNSCAAKLKPHKRGDDIIYSQGYAWTWRPEHPKAHDGRVKRSRLVLEDKLGRYLKDDCLPHHSNDNKLDDRPDNLDEVTKLKHFGIHVLLRGRDLEQKKRAKKTT